MTSYYRLLNRHGGYTWIQSCATVVCNSKNNDEQSIVCVNYILRYSTVTVAIRQFIYI